MCNKKIRRQYKTCKIGEYYKVFEMLEMLSLRRSSNDDVGENSAYMLKLISYSLYL